MPPSPYQEIRDPIHVFVKLDDDELKVLNSAPVQRLRNIHQLAMSYLVYPGATHRRFEHSLGVMELAGQVFDVVTHEANLVDQVRDEIGGQLLKSDERLYWRKALRMAALCHDIGHLPFSHAAEESMLPEGWSHEHISARLILGEEMKSIWESMRPPLNALDVAKLAVGEAKMAKIHPETRYSTWESLLYEIIGSDTLGVDRMDYLLRDSLHIGVAYGRFDHHRLIDSMRMLPTHQGSPEPTLGITHGGIHTAEALLLARYSMFMQVYYHRTRLAYDCLLADFLKEWLPGGQFPDNISTLNRVTDNTVLQAIDDSAWSPQKPGHVPARRILHREHFRQLYRESPTDWKQVEDSQATNPAKLVYDACVNEFGTDNLRYVATTQNEPDLHFPVLDSDRRITPSTANSETLNRIPVARHGFVLIAPDLVDAAKEWLETQKTDIISSID